MFEAEAKDTRQELNKWLEKNGEELKKKVAENSEALAKFKKELKVIIKQANADANKKLAIQASDLSTILEEVSSELDSVSQQFAEKVEATPEDQ